MVPFILYSFSNKPATLKQPSPIGKLLLASLFCTTLNACTPAPKNETPKNGARVTFESNSSDADLENTRAQNLGDQWASGVLKKGVRVTFETHFQGAPLACDQLLTINNEAWQVSELAMFFHQFSFNNLYPIVLDNNDWQSQQVALIRSSAGCNDSQGNMSVSGYVNVPEGLDEPNESLMSLSFNIGVPFAINHQNPLLQESPLNDSSMFWAWRNGYKFVRWDMQRVVNVIDGSVAVNSLQGAAVNSAQGAAINSVQGAAVNSAQGAAINSAQGADDKEGIIHNTHVKPHNMNNTDAWSFHLGSVGCESAAMVRAPKKPCFQPNVIPVEVALKNNDNIQITLIINLDKILGNITATRQNTCMFSSIDDETCNQLVKNLTSENVFE